MRSAFLCLVSLVALVTTPGSLLAAEPVRAFWPMMEYLAQSTSGSGSDTATGPMGLQIPNLMVYSPRGALVWSGEPGEFDAERIDLDPAGTSTDALTAVLQSLDGAWEQFPDFRHDSATGKPSTMLKPGAPTAILVIATHRVGTCASCDAAAVNGAGLPPGWNLIIASIAK